MHFSNLLFFVVSLLTLWSVISSRSIQVPTQLYQKCISCFKGKETGTVLDPFRCCDCCGLRKPEGRLMKGHQASYAPWTVHVSVYGNPSMFCSGIVIDFEWVITQAHCFLYLKNIAYNKFVRKVSIEKGQILITAGRSAHSNDYENNQYVYGAEAYIHSEFLHKKGDVHTINDFALIRLETKLVPNYNVLPICLGNDNPVSGINATFQGWGALNFGPRPRQTDKLQEASFQIIDREVCKRKYKKKAGRDIVSIEHVCAESFVKHQNKTLVNKDGKKEEVGICGGDSGGPLFHYVNNRAYLIGLASWGGVCDQYPNHPSVFTSVKEMFNLIEEIVSLKKCDKFGS